MISLQSYEPGALRVPLKSPVRENRTPGSVRGRPGNRAFLPRYSSWMARWLNRDPIGEKGGRNLYGMVENNSVNDWDKLGLTIGGSMDAGAGGPETQEDLNPIPDYSKDQTTYNCAGLACETYENMSEEKAREHLKREGRELKKGEDCRADCEIKCCISQVESEFI